MYLNLAPLNLCTMTLDNILSIQFFQVYFIRYKAAPKKKPQQSSGNSLYGAPSQQYGVGSAPKPIVVEAPSPTQPTQRKREVVSVSSEVNEKIDDDETSGFGDRVKFERD